jgi:L-lactate dehydrogenase (cytochrome)
MFARPLARAARAGRSSARRFVSTSTSTSSGFTRVALAAAGAAVVAGTTYAFLPQAHADALRVTKAGERIITLEELGKHWQAGSLWVAVDGKVYDVSDFANIHPGGIRILLENGGRDATKLFHAIHPPNTIRKYAKEVPCVGVIDPEELAALASQRSAEDDRIDAARKALFGVDSVVGISDFERYAKDLLPLHAWAYYSTGADTEGALTENAAIFKRLFFRPRIMRDVHDVDTSTEFLGVKSSIPVYVAPTARNGLGQPEGEVAVTRGAGATGIFQVLSHYASRSLEEVKAAAREGQQIGWQLYLNPDRERSREAIEEAVEAGAHSIWITADTVTLGKRETERRLNAEANPAPNGKPLSRERQRFGFSAHDTRMSWDDIAFVKKHAPGLPVVIKGVGAWEDVVLAYKYGADAVVLSNHGGRQLDFAQPPMKVLYEVNKNAPQVLHRKNFNIFLDGGVRHGTDVLKALCLGATAVGLGRPFIYAATGWGSDGVEKAVELLEEEITIGMQLLGVTRVDQLGPQYLDTSKI